MKRNKSIKLIILGLLIVFGVAILITNPLLRSEENIRERLLESTPIGTNMGDVIKFIENNKKWKIDQISYEHGFNHQGIYPSREVGEKSIRVELGDYRFVLETSVTVFWGFNKNSELIDIWVWKTVDSI